ncbi:MULTISPECIES: DUF368 domain-containing protein [Bacillaceae]|uniref:DUF368 domain-containing protein n=1 Tax=Evansella alkalicola TaxID=745819 RepID=A0ABS6JSU6_9BACI|nr:MULTISPECIES: DUF368 domain-containing protein [Bacillaceae]MBU9721495.1 DUF368 domain-containing protein [Bacillus alkalicola]
MIRTVLKGMLIGITETVPGVSGSTIAMILGVYEKLVYSLSLLTTKHRREAYPFLIKLGMGMTLGFVMFLYVIRFLLETYRTPTLMFFAGIIVGFIPYLVKEATIQGNVSFKLKHFLIIIIFIAIVAMGQFIGGNREIDVSNLHFSNYIFLFFSGILASTALVLPGISGALILTILGIYEIAASSIFHLNFSIIIPIGLGVVVGILLTSKLVRYLLNEYTMETYSAMIGLVTGSIIAIVSELETNVSSMVLTVSALTFLVGIFFVTFIMNIRRNKEGRINR